MILEVNGTAYGDFTGIRISRRLDALCRSFSFDAVRIGNTPLPFKGGEDCRILDNGDVLLTGNIERLDVNYAVDSHTITMSGRDKTGNVVDSSLRAVGDYSPPITLKRCIELALKDIGSSITVVDNANIAPFKKSSDLIAPEPGQNAFEFIEKLARSRQVLVTSDSDGRIVITRAATTRSTGALQNIVGAEDNNIKAGAISYDNTGRYREYRTLSSGNPTALISAGSVGNSSVVSQSGGVTDSNVKAGRQLILQSESSQSNDWNNARAQWEADVRKARGRLYSVTVQGFRTQGGDLWAENTLVPVVDAFTGLRGDMLISGVEYRYDETQGSITGLQLMPPNAFTLTLEEPRAQVTGNGLI